jgi:hypothetical protein
MDTSGPELFFLAFISFWIGISFFVARIGGWATIATFYRLSGSFNGEIWRFQSGEFRWKIGCNNCLTLE